VIGLTPQVITETIYALAKTCPEALPTELHVITTQQGFERVRLTLLDEKAGWLAQLRKDYGLPPILFNHSHIHVIEHADSPINDIRTEKDNEILADTITRHILAFTSDPHASLHVSIAGGRKTMSYYAGYALSLFARPQDKLSHVLVSEDFESVPEFFYPTPYSKIIQFKRGDRQYFLDAQEAKVSLAYIPFVRLRQELPAHLLSTNLSFMQSIQLTQKVIGELSVCLNVKQKTLTASGVNIPLKPVNLAFYWLLLEDRLKQANGVQYKLNPELHELFLALYAELIGKHHGDYIELEDKLIKNNGIYKEWFDERLSRINKAFIENLGKTGAMPYLPAKAKRNQPRALTLLPVEAIHIVKETA
jgi:CRISPR-associated protein (TIGR02584 family)